MAWTTPRTWVSGETVTASIMNTHVRDNLSALYTDATAQVGPGIDSNWPEVLVRHNTTQTLGAAWNLVSFNTEVVDTESAFATTRFTVPADCAGDYLITTWGCKSSAGTTGLYLAIYRNGASMGTEHHGVEYSTVSISFVESLAVSDYIEVKAWSTAGVSLGANDGSFGQWWGNGLHILRIA